MSSRGLTSVINGSPTGSVAKNARPNPPDGPGWTLRPGGPRGPGNLHHRGPCGPGGPRGPLLPTHGLLKMDEHCLLTPCCSLLVCLRMIVNLLASVGIIRIDHLY